MVDFITTHCHNTNVGNLLYLFSGHLKHVTINMRFTQAKTLTIKEEVLVSVGDEEQTSQPSRISRDCPGIQSLVPA